MILFRGIAFSPLGVAAYRRQRATYCPLPILLRLPRWYFVRTMLEPTLRRSADGFVRDSSTLSGSSAAETFAFDDERIDVERPVSDRFPQLYRRQEGAAASVRMLKHPRSTHAQPMRDFFRAEQLFRRSPAIS